MTVPANARFIKTHEYLLPEPDGTVKVTTPRTRTGNPFAAVARSNSRTARAVVSAPGTSCAETAEHRTISRSNRKRAGTPDFSNENDAARGKRTTREAYARGSLSRRPVEE